MSDEPDPEFLARSNALSDLLTQAAENLRAEDVTGASVAIDRKDGFCVVVTFGEPGASLEQQILVCQKAQFALAVYTQNLQRRLAGGHTLAAEAVAQRASRGYNDA